MKSSISELIDLQRQLAADVIRTDEAPQTVRTIAGVDAAFPRAGKITRGAAVLMSYPDLEIIDESVAELPTRLPYIPGLLSFRELPALLAALKGLRARPDIVLCDGQGLAHPRRLGIACHLGVVTGLCTIGVAKSRLCGCHDEPGPNKGDHAALTDNGEVIGTVLRTRSGVRPVYVSTGHRMGLNRAVRLVLAMSPRYRLPEPVRRADRLAGGRQGRSEHP